jgi:hypothetical protein
MTREYVHYNLTSADKDRVVSLYKDLKSALKVSKIVGFKIDKIYDVLKELNVERPVTSSKISKLGEDTEKRIVDLYRTISPWRISKELDVAMSSVIHVLLKHGVYKRVNKTPVFIWSCSQKRTICSLYKSGLTIREIAKKFNASTEPIRQILLKNGVKLKPMAAGIQVRVSYKSKLGKTYKLKSCYELAFAKTLDRLGFVWDYESIFLRLGKRRYYRPDFIFYENGNISWIVEIKGDENNKEEQRVWKVLETIKKYPDLKIVILFKQDVNAVKDVISPYSLTKFLERGYGKTRHIRLRVGGPTRSNASVQTG